MSDLRHVLGLLELDRWRVVRAVLVASLTLATAAGLAAISAWLIMRAWERPPVLDLTVAVVTVRALGISRGVSRYLDRLASHDVALRGAAHARGELYVRLSRGASTPALRTGDVLLRSGRDLDLVADTVVRVLVPAAVAAVLTVGSVTALALLAPAAAVAMAAFALLAGVAAPLVATRAALGAERAVADATAEQAAAAVLVVDHAEELAVGGRLDAVIGSIAETGTARRAAERRADAAAARAVAAVPAGMLATTLVALLVGVLAYDGTAHSPMWLGILVLLPLAAFEALAALPAAGEHLARAVPAAERIRAMLDAAGERAAGADPGVAGAGSPTTPATSAALLSATGLTWGFGGRSLAEAPLDLDLRAGDRVVVRGPSGVGKSVLARTLAGLDAPVTGTVRAGGADLATLTRPERRGRVVYLAEDAHLFSTTVRDDLLVARGDAHDDELRAALDAVGLGAWLDGLPEGLDTVLEGGASAVSGGQRRRLLLARALLVTAPVVVLDEPTEHLGADDAGDLLRRICAAGEEGRVGPGPTSADGLFGPDRAVVVVTHDRTTAIEASREIELAARQPA